MDTSGDTAVIPRKVPKEYKVEKVVPSDKIKKDKVTETREFTTGICRLSNNIR